MTRRLQFLLIALALLFEFLFVQFYFLAWQHSAIAGVSYRHEERVEAYRAYLQNPSQDTKITFEKEKELMLRHEAWKICGALGLLVSVNAGTIYYILRPRRKIATA